WPQPHSEPAPHVRGWPSTEARWLLTDRSMSSSTHPSTWAVARPRRRPLANCNRGPCCHRSAEARGLLESAARRQVGNFFPPGFFGNFFPAEFASGTLAVYSAIRRQSIGSVIPHPPGVAKRRSS